MGGVRVFCYMGKVQVLLWSAFLNREEIAVKIPEHQTAIQKGYAFSISHLES